MERLPALLKIKVLHDAIEEPFCLNDSIKNLYHLKNLSVSPKLLCGENVLQVIIKRCSLTEWFFVEPETVLLYHRCEEPFKQCYI